MTTTAEAPAQITRLTQAVHLDITPRPGQTLEQARDEFRHALRAHLSDPDGPFWSDYGATVDSIRAAHADGEQPVWGGYEGPYITSVIVTDPPVRDTGSLIDSLGVHLSSIADLLGGDGHENAEYARALGEHTRQVLGLPGDCFAESLTEIGAALGAPGMNPRAVQEFIGAMHTTVEYLVSVEASHDPARVAATVTDADRSIFGQRLCAGSGLHPDHADAAAEILLAVLTAN